MEVIKTPDVVFPNLGISIDSLNRVAINIFGFSIYWYGIMLMLGVLAGYLIAVRGAKKAGEDPAMYTNFLFIVVIACIIGARIYYVIFSWEDFRGDLLAIFNTRKGGMAIYGTVIAAVITAVVYTRVKKIDFFKFTDIAIFGLIAGQVIGRLGNFINKEAFGEFTNSFLAIQYKLADVDKSNVTQMMMDNLVLRGNVSYIQVHPTFLYEMLWNIGLFILMSVYKRYKAFEGELFALYFVGYGIGRYWIEGMRTDQLKLGGTNIPVSQLLSFLLALGGIAFIIYKRRMVKKANG